MNRNQSQTEPPPRTVPCGPPPAGPLCPAGENYGLFTSLACRPSAARLGIATVLLTVAEQALQVDRGCVVGTTGGFRDLASGSYRFLPHGGSRGEGAWHDGVAACGQEPSGSPKTGCKHSSFSDPKCMAPNTCLFLLTICTKEINFIYFIHSFRNRILLLSSCSGGEERTFLCGRCSSHHGALQVG